MKLTRIIFGLLLIVSVSLKAEEELVDVNIRNLSLHEFVEWVSKITQTNILIEGELQGKINFVAQVPVKKSALIPLANSILSGKGLTLVDQGEFYKVVKANIASGEGLEVSSNIDGETMKTVLFPLPYIL